MKLKITFKNKGKQIPYKELPDFFHKIFATALFSVINHNKNKEKKEYSFKIPDIKYIEPNKEYIIYFNSLKEEYCNAIHENLQKSELISIIKIEKINNTYQPLKTLSVKGICFSLSSGFCDSKKINRIRDGKIKTNINYTIKYHSIELLKELIEYQITKKFNEYSKEKLDLYKIGNVFYNECITDLIIKKSYFRFAKNFNIPCFDIEFKLNKSIDVNLSTKIGNFILQEGLGAKNSFGFGYVYQKKEIS